MNLLAGAGASAILVALYYALASRGKKYPPGPKPHWLLGNALDMPLDRIWETFTEWRKIYGEYPVSFTPKLLNLDIGDVVYLNALGQPMIILNSHRACMDLLEKRSIVYSDRPRFVMLIEV